MFSAAKHKIISVQDYQDLQNRQTAEKCAVHLDNPVRLACMACDELFCDDCNLQLRCDKGI